MERILTVQLTEEDVANLKNAANLLLDLEDAVQNKGNARLEIAGIESPLLAKLLESFQLTAGTVEKNLTITNNNEA